MVQELEGKPIMVSLMGYRDRLVRYAIPKHE